ncbi:MAG: hypothetical protein GQ574_26730 [Crocinitomix sp.]|nr:hypothetical protein [Crocinitomix sp.]
MEKKKFKGGMFITTRDIQIITGTVNDRVARREHLNIRDALGKKHGRITIKEYCDYWEIDLAETLEFLSNNR